MPALTYLARFNPQRTGDGVLTLLRDGRETGWLTFFNFMALSGAVTALRRQGYVSVGEYSPCQDCPSK